jgi:hypothetical protein
MKERLPEWQRTAATAVPTDLVQDLVSDFRRGPAKRSTPIATKPETVRSSGLAVERPLAPPPGVNLVDRLCDAQDVLDQAERSEKLRRR